MTGKLISFENVGKVFHVDGRTVEAVCGRFGFRPVGTVLLRRNQRHNFRRTAGVPFSSLS